MNQTNNEAICSACNVSSGWITRAATIKKRFGAVSVVDRGVMLPHCGACGDWSIEAKALEVVEIKAAVAAIRDTVGGLNGEGMKVVRKILGLTQAQFAKLVGYEAAENISRLESGDREYPRAIQLAALFYLEAGVRGEIDLHLLSDEMKQTGAAPALPHDARLEVTKERAA